MTIYCIITEGSGVGGELGPWGAEVAFKKFFFFHHTNFFYKRTGFYLTIIIDVKLFCEMIMFWRLF